MGVTKPASDDDEVVVYREPARGIYKKLIVRGGQIAGAMLLGDIEAASTLMQMFVGGNSRRRHAAPISSSVHRAGCRC